MFQDLQVTDANPQNHCCCSLGTGWIQQQQCRQVQAQQNGLYHPEYRKPVYLALSWVTNQPLTRLRKIYIPIYCCLWYLMLKSHFWARCENECRSGKSPNSATWPWQGQSAAPAADGALGTVFHNRNQTWPQWHFPSVDQYSNSTFL